MTVKGASLLPQDFAVGGVIPDGEYTITKSETDLFNYPGTQETAPTLHIYYVDSDGTEFDQHYSAGKTEFLVPSEDKKRFVHPSGGEAKISKSSNTSLFIAALLQGGFPTAGLSDDVSAFAGHRVQIENRAQPKRPGLKDDKEKAIPLPVRYLGEAKGARSARGAAGKPATSPTQQTAASTASSTTPTNGAELNGKAISVVQAILGEAAENTSTALKLSSTAMLRLSKAKDPDTTAVKKLITGEWLMANAEAGGWVSDGETAILSQ